MFETLLKVFPETTIEYKVIKALELFFRSTEWLAIISLLKTLSFLISVFLFCLLVYLFLRLNVLKGKIESITSVVKAPAPAQATKRFKQEFKKIKKKINSNNPEDDRWAIIQAEELLRQALAIMGFKDQPLPVLIKQVVLWHEVKPEELLRAHDLRNQAVHYTQSLIHAEVEAAVTAYEKALKDLGFL